MSAFYVTVKEALDYETQTFYSLDIEGENYGPWRVFDSTQQMDYIQNIRRKTNPERVRIQVKDAPDQPPSFFISSTILSGQGFNSH